MAIKLIDQAVQSGASLPKACAVIGLSARTLRRWKQSPDLQDQRHLAAQSREVSHALTEQEKQEIVSVCNQPEYQSLPPSQIVPLLADQGRYIASESSFYRVLKEFGQNNKRGRERKLYKHHKPKAFVANGPCQVWSWDITLLPTEIKGQFLRLYMIEDVFSRAITAWEIHESESAEHASELIEKACWKHKIRKGQLVLHSDNGSPMKGSTMLSKLQTLGIIPSFSRPSVSDDNPYCESLFRTLKYCPAYPAKPFSGLEQARQWVHRFVSWYNTTHRHSSIGFVTPAQRHKGIDKEILQARHDLYEQAKTNNPKRWQGRATRNWKRIEKVWLNPDNLEKIDDINVKIAA
jgi:putative transposase